MIKFMNINNSVFKWFIKKSFPIFQRIGSYITMNHYHKPIPDARTLKEELWSNHYELIGIDIREKIQINLHYLLHFKFKWKYERFSRNKIMITYQSCVNNGAFESLESEILSSIIRYFKSKKIIWIEADNSTYLADQAILKDKEEEGDGCELMAIEPYQNYFMNIGFPGLSELIHDESRILERVFF